MNASGLGQRQSQIASSSDSHSTQQHTTPESNQLGGDGTMLAVTAMWLRAECTNYDPM